MKNESSKLKTLRRFSSLGDVHEEIERCCLAGRPRFLLIGSEGTSETARLLLQVSPLLSRALGAVDGELATTGVAVDKEFDALIFKFDF